jgi:hypothetical protein
VSAVAVVASSVVPGCVGDGVGVTVVVLCSGTTSVDVEVPIQASETFGEFVLESFSRHSPRTRALVVVSR